MKKYKLFTGTILILTVFLFACGILSSPIQTTEKVSTKPPELPNPVTPSQEHPIPITGDLGEAAIELGARYQYADGTLLVGVPQGEFVMGGEGDDNPEHNVTLSDFWIYSTKVTNQQYNLCVDIGKCSPPDMDDNKGFADPSRMNDPVVGVSYDQAAAYCDFMNARLPTEAEWEKAARGPDGNIYPWGDIAPSCDLLNFNNCVGMTTNVIGYPEGASYYGGLDFAGNTFEWVADWYDPQYYTISPTENPPGPDVGNTRSVRSSGYDTSLDEVLIANRFFSNPIEHRQDLGFRCVVEEPDFFTPFCESALIYGLDSNGLVLTQDTNQEENCPRLDIFQAKYCSNKVPTTNVTFTGPPESVIDFGDCLPSGDPALFVCQSPGTVSS